MRHIVGSQVPPHIPMSKGSNCCLSWASGFSLSGILVWSRKEGRTCSLLLRDHLSETIAHIQTIELLRKNMMLVVELGSVPFSAHEDVCGSADVGGRGIPWHVRLGPKAFGALWPAADEHP